MCFAGFQDGCGPVLTSAVTGGIRRCSSARRPQKQRSPPLVVGMRFEHSLMERAAATQPPVFVFETIPSSSQVYISTSPYSGQPWCSLIFSWAACCFFFYMMSVTKRNISVFKMKCCLSAPALSAPVPPGWVWLSLGNRGLV